MPELLVEHRLGSGHMEILPVIKTHNFWKQETIHGRKVAKNYFLFVHGLMANFIYLPGCPQHNCLQDELTVKDKNIHPLKNESLN